MDAYLLPYRSVFCFVLLAVCACVYTLTQQPLPLFTSNTLSVFSVIL